VYLAAVVCHRLKDGSKSLEARSDIEEVDSEEEVVEVTHHREGEVPGGVEERLQPQTGNSQPYLHHTRALLFL